MQKINFVIGSTLCAYAELNVEIPNGASTEQIRELVRSEFERQSDDGSLVMDEDWSTQADFRIVTCNNPALLGREQYLSLYPPTEEDIDPIELLQRVHASLLAMADFHKDCNVRSCALTAGKDIEDVLHKAKREMPPPTTS